MAFSRLLTRLSAEEPILTWPRAAMLWHSGLRGGIALTLALELNDWAEHKAILVMATFIVITAFLIVMGSTVDFMLEALQIPRGPEQQGQSLTYAELLRNCEAHE